jgi:putative ABC transport system permease protein
MTMSGVRRLLEVTAINFSGFKERLWTSLVAIVGVACAVGVLLSMLSFSTGLSQAVQAAANPIRAVAVAKGNNNELGANIPREAAAAIMSAPGIQKDVDGRPIASAEHLANLPAKRKVDQLPVRVVLRGIGEKGTVLRPELKLVSGRMFQPGVHELIVGVSAQAQYEGMDVGNKVILPDGEWTIVGAFETGGDMIEGQLLGEVESILAARQRDAYGTVIVRLESVDAFDKFKAALMANPSLQLDIERQPDFYDRTVSGQVTRFLSAVAYMLGTIMAIGALFGTLNTMYSGVSSRTREIATLRALGFGGFSVAVSVLVEALLLALVGALLGAGAAWLLFNGNQNALGTNVFHLAITSDLVRTGLVWAAVIALIGGIFPALRAARLPVATALRAA